MQIIVNQKTEIRWKEPSNTSINNTIADCKIDEIFRFSSAVIPAVGNSITYCKCKYLIVEVNYIIDSEDNLIDYVEITVMPQVYYINYYPYMKMFTHCCDYTKSHSDPTCIENHQDYVFIKPTSIAEWLEDMQILESSPSDKKRIELVNRRSVKKDLV